MQFTDLLRSTVFLSAAAATALALIAVISAGDAEDTLLLAVSGGWWAIAVVVGSLLGTPERSAEAVRPLLADARTATQLPSETPGRLMLGRLWPVLGFVLVAGGGGIVIPQVASIGAGFALLVALSWRNREAAVTAIEDRDGVCFYVLPGSALEPIKLMRSPGLMRGKDPGGAQPPPTAS